MAASVPFACLRSAAERRLLALLEGAPILVLPLDAPVGCPAEDDGGGTRRGVEQVRLGEAQLVAGRDEGAFGDQTLRRSRR